MLVGKYKMIKRKYKKGLFLASFLRTPLAISLFLSISKKNVDLNNKNSMLNAIKGIGKFSKVS